MPVYEYKALDAQGRKTTGIVDAENAKSARARLRRQGIFPTEVREQRAGRATRGRALNREIDLKRYFQRVKLQDVATATGQLATLVGAGVPLVEALSALIDQTESPPLKLVLVEVREDVNQGSSLADAMRKHPKVFSDLYVNMVRAGETSGALEVVLQRLADYTEAQVRLRGQVVSAMVYPVLMGAVSLLIIVALFVFVIPRIRRIFDSFGAALPLITRMMLGLSDFIIHYWWLVILLVGGAIYGFVRWIRSEKGRPRWHRFKLTVPILGRVNRLVAVSRFCRTFSTLLDSGVPILTAVHIVRTVVQNDVLADAIEQAGRNIREGESIAQPLRESGEFPPLVTHMIAIGERTGELEPMLAKVADAYDQQVENILGALTSLLEPILIIVLGGVVVVVALSILLPMLNLSAIAS